MPLIALAAPPPTNPLTATSLNINGGALEITSAGALQRTGAIRLLSNEVDGPTAVGHIFDTGSAWSTAGNKLISFRENGTEFGYLTENNVSNEFQLQTRSLYSLGLYGAVSIRLHSTAADGASAMAAYVDTSSAWSDAGAKLFVVRTNGSERMRMTPAGHILFGIAGVGSRLGNYEDTTIDMAAGGTIS